MTIMRTQSGFPTFPPVPLTGVEPLHDDGKPVGSTMLDFWRWAASDLVSNTMRGVLAEYLVANALGLPQSVRVEWQAFDLETPHGTKIEVKSAAYLQAWHHAKLSTISFGIRPTQAWDDVIGLYAPERKRQADLYIFCLLHHQDKQTLDPLNVHQWRFYLLPASILDERLPVQKTMSLASLLRLQPQQVNYDELNACISQWEQRMGGQTRPA